MRVVSGQSELEEIMSSVYRLTRCPLKHVIGVAALSAILLATLRLADQSKPQASGSATANPWKYYPKDRAVGDGGPAPKRDLTGTWAGPSSGANVPRSRVAAENPRAPMLTPLGE